VAQLLLNFFQFSHAISIFFFFVFKVFNEKFTDGAFYKPGIVRNFVFDQNIHNRVLSGAFVDPTCLRASFANSDDYIVEAVMCFKEALGKLR
jgi:hypothetical protein